MLGWSISARACRSASNRAITCLVSIPHLMSLQRHLAPDGLFLLRLVHHAHAAAADLPYDAVGSDPAPDDPIGVSELQPIDGDLPLTHSLAVLGRGTLECATGGGLTLLVRGDEGLHLVAKLRAVGEGLQKCGSVRRLELERRPDESLDPTLTFGLVHGLFLSFGVSVPDRSRRAPCRRIIEIVASSNRTLPHQIRSPEWSVLQ